jgi:hypothetical protein
MVLTSETVPLVVVHVGQAVRRRSSFCTRAAFDLTYRDLEIALLGFDHAVLPMTCHVMWMAVVGQGCGASLWSSMRSPRPSTDSTRTASAC